MNLTLLHGSMEPVIYGLVIFLGLLSMVWKLKRHAWLAFGMEVFVFILVFKLHGGTMSGGFAATIAALLAGLIFPLLFGSKPSKPSLTSAPQQPSQASNAQAQAFIAEIQRRTEAAQHEADLERARTAQLLELIRKS